MRSAALDAEDRPGGVGMDEGHECSLVRLHRDLEIVVGVVLVAACHSDRPSDSAVSNACHLDDPAEAVLRHGGGDDVPVAAFPHRDRAEVAIADGVHTPKAAVGPNSPDL